MCAIIADSPETLAMKYVWWLFFVHTMNCYICDSTASAIPLHMRVYGYRTREITSAVYGRNAENEPVSRIKMADTVRSTIVCGRKYGNAIAIF